MIREGSGEPLVLFHGVTSSGQVWRDVVPLLADHHEVIAPTALGHHGGRVPTRRPVGIADIVDDAERRLDELGIDRAHLAGNSMGGWMALELARRGRARSVCALSPAGMWEAGGEDMDRVYTILESAVRDVRRTRPLLPVLAHSKRFRRRATVYLSLDGAGIPPTDLIARFDDVLGCEPLSGRAAGEAFSTLDPAPCPVTIAWSAADRLFPIDHYGPRAQALVPAAEFLALDGVGHVPMLDDPGLVARTILATSGATTGID